MLRFLLDALMDQLQTLLNFFNLKVFRHDDLEEPFDGIACRLFFVPAVAHIVEVFKQQLALCAFYAFFYPTTSLTFVNTLAVHIGKALKVLEQRHEVVVLQFDDSLLELPLEQFVLIHIR